MIEIKLRIEEATKEVLDLAMKDVEDFMEYVGNQAQNNLDKHGTTDTGMLKKSKDVYQSGEYEFTCEFNSPTGIWIEYGTQPHPVSEEGRRSIEKWARRKLGLSDEEAERASYAICWKIRQKGTEPQPFLRPAIEDALANFRR
jgi:adenylate cyclase class IV